MKKKKKERNLIKTEDERVYNFYLDYNYMFKVI